ncbi:BlaI/MecI/CopY family transcriptional regulator [Nocardioides massiliensis]|uniref:Transcriptional regulator n=1 Tax=Nocardioides massiliensis TaxID=1325935 RepID=A0ABT9NQE6_9ACTN|nr:BlaI/MecI/CopY family transcriptional regulator [Nocardioides massiliensis]MDP9822651.1 putative transcriptional regulator [Nocardioides massiliensis]
MAADVSETASGSARGARVGDLEKAVLDVLWDSPRRSSSSRSPDDESRPWRTVRDVFAVIEAERPIAYTTVMTVLARMAKKGLVEQHRQGKAYLYRAAGSRGEMAADLMRQALGSVADDAGGARDALVAFVGEASEEERAALREALARLEG